MNLLFVLCLFELAILLASANNDKLSAAKKNRIMQKVKELEEDFARYPNMSLVLLKKCSKLAPHKIAPCTLSVLDNDQNLLMGMLKTDPFTLINLINKHTISFPNIPVRVMKDGSQCKKPEIVTDHDQLVNFYQQSIKKYQKTTP